MINSSTPKLSMAASRGRFRGECRLHAPPLFFAEITCLPLCRCLRQKKNIHQIVRIHFENYIFSSPLRGTSSSCTPVPIGAEVLSVLNLGVPSFKRSLICPWQQAAFNNFKFKGQPNDFQDSATRSLKYSLTNTSYCFLQTLWKCKFMKISCNKKLFFAKSKQ